MNTEPEPSVPWSEMTGSVVAVTYGVAQLLLVGAKDPDIVTELDEIRRTLSNIVSTA
jgi:hypothetical protein